jgi:hypothetical protein
MSHRQRIVPEVRDPVIAALVQAHDRPIEQIDRGHQHTLTF